MPPTASSSTTAGSARCPPPAPARSTPARRARTPSRSPSRTPRARTAPTTPTSRRRSRSGTTGRPSTTSQARGTDTMPQERRGFRPLGEHPLREPGPQGRRSPAAGLGRLVLLAGVLVLAAPFLPSLLGYQRYVLVGQ